MSEFRVEKVNNLPASLTANTVYVVQNGSFSEIFVSNSAGSAARKVNITHNDAFEKQGGDGKNYYHLGQNQFDNFNSIANPNLSWQTLNVSLSGQVWKSISFGNNIYIAICVQASTGIPLAMTSKNGIEWQGQDGLSKGMNDITFGNGLFVSITEFGIIDSFRVATTSDGITWTLREVPQLNAWVSITFGNNVYVAVSRNGTNRVITSDDGITWTARNAAENNEWRSITFGNGLFVAVSSNGTNRVMTSSDGITWTARSSSQQNSWRSVTYGNGLYVAVSSDGNNRVMTSPDGIIWTARNITSKDWRVVTFGNGLFVCLESIVSQTASFGYSKDGINWETGTTSQGGLWSKLFFSNGKFFAINDFTETNSLMIGGFEKFINHSQLNLDDGRNPHQTRYEDLLGTPPSLDRNIDGGSANSIYLPSQNIDGGGA